MIMGKRDVVVVSGARTPFGKHGGALKGFKAVELGGIAIKEALKRAGVKGTMVDEVIMGIVMPSGVGQVPGRQAALYGDVPHEVPVLTINKACGSALKAVILGAQMIKAGDADIIVAGGMESMTNVPFVSFDMRWGNKMGDVRMQDDMLDGLICPENKVHMAVIGGEVAKEYGVTRKEQDQWALRSQKRWDAAEKENKFKEEITPVEIKTKKGITIFEKDESPRPETTIEDLQKLPPVFVKEGTVTAGNAPGVNDGGSAVVLMSREKAEELGAPILAIIKDYSQVAQPSKYIATVPGLSIKKILEKNNKTLDDFDLIEINEAFAAVPLVSCKLLGMDKETMDKKVNVNGSAVAVGHPVGATGARLLMTIINEMRRENKKNGLCAICSAMAQGDAVWVSIE